MTAKTLITHARLREVLSYDPETGVFTALIDRGPVKAGDRVGGPTVAGYTQLTIDGVFYLGHVLAWFYMTKQWPKNKIDHRNNTPGDDWFENLREATDSENNFNRRIQRNNKCGYKGVSFFKGDKYPRKKPCCAEVRAHGKRVWSAYFSTPEEAAEARGEVVKRVHGSFAHL